MSVPVSALQNLIDLKTPPDEIRWRDGQRQHAGDCPRQKTADGKCPLGHKQLAYIDARYVMGVLDTLIGPENWQRLHKSGPATTVLCGIAINIEGTGWVEKWDGAGETDIEGEKGAVSDSFKRAAVSWGIGRDLYAMKPQSGVNSNPAAVAAINASLARAADDLNDEEFDRAVAATPAPRAPQFPPIGSNAATPPKCPTHGYDLKPATDKQVRAGHKKPGEWWCSGKTNGNWCPFTWIAP